MTGLRELFEEAAGSAPPSRLLADEVYTAGRRRWRRRRLAVAALPAVAATAVLAASLLATPRPAGDEPPVAGGAGAPASAGERPGQRLQWVDTADARHLYLLSTCTTPGTCDKSLAHLSGSDDGGRSWTDRGTPTGLGPMAVLGPDVLITAAPPDQPGATGTSLMISTDGGRHWRRAQESPPVGAVPDGGTAICWPETAGASCTVQVVEPESYRVAPLSQQPALLVQPDGLRIDGRSGRLWIPGREPATGRPAVAVSADAGRTWASHVFRDAPSCPDAGCQPLSLAVDGGGKRVYAVAAGERAVAVYRLTGGTTGDGWQRLTDTDEIPPGTNGYGSFVAADGSHVLFQPDDRHTFGYRYWAARGGGAYRSVELAGLPATAGPVRRTRDGRFYAIDGPANVLYGSTDGWHWSPITDR
ncbi:hypothetical protein ACIBPB_25410 [Micromonospora sp. NPDC049836]|uniref:hypothetical protein n=1 Tax=Micromonospora sp. NPDC049836 TaxID=3364274 RepID=UPI0037B31F0E